MQSARSRSFAALGVALVLPSTGLAQAASQPASMPASMPASSSDPGPSSMPASSGEPAAPPALVEEPAPPPAPVEAAPPAPAHVIGDYVARPTQAESATVLYRGAGLLEAGLRFDTTLDEASLLKAHSLAAPALMLRYGVLDGLEVRAGATYTVTGTVTRVGNATNLDLDGKLSQVSLGASVAISEESSYLPAAALIMSFGLPLGTLMLEDFSATSRLAVSKTVFDRLTLAANLGASWDGANETFVFHYNGVTALAIAGGVGVFGEVYGDAYPTLDASLWVDGGLYYDVTDRVRLDATAGISTLGGAGNWFGGVGASFFLPGL